MQADNEASADSAVRVSFVDSSSSLPTAADDLVSSSILSALSSSAAQAESDFETQPEPEIDTPVDDSEAVTKFRQAVEDLISDRRETRSVDGEFKAESIPMEGSMASAEWTAFDQLAQQREDLDDSLDWSIVVNYALSSVVIPSGQHCLTCSIAPSDMQLGTAWPRVMSL